MVVSENGLDDPDQNFYENYACSAARNYGGYCNQEVDALIDRQSIETDPEKRRLLVWEIERKLIEDDVRPVLFHPRAAVCNQPCEASSMNSGSPPDHRQSFCGASPRSA
jgi:peptide/nickel transport system substrate-binding protein